MPAFDIRLVTKKDDFDADVLQDNLDEGESGFMNAL